MNLNIEERAAIAALHLEAAAICTATLIAPGWAITAAHCAVDAELLVRSSAQLEPTFVATGKVVHPELDVALLALDPLKDIAAAPIPLWDGAIDQRFSGVTATLAGTGSTETGSSGDLRFVEETIVKVMEKALWVDGMGRSGACHGDSGGPLLVANQRGEARVAGVLDRGSADCVGIDVYTRADVFRAWTAERVSPPSSASCVGDTGE